MDGHHQFLLTRFQKLLLMPTQGYWQEGYKNIIVNCVHPGYVVTNMTSQTGYITAEEGAKGPVMTALLPDDGPSGVFFNKTNIAPFFTTDWVLN
ncbi:glucose/ribitol dehydrogenase [Artemisia annua]|uniref:Glucose/ribitol dehydrogenase n=1 Tax=Artemisia annua TaxID=35608 RepID=A0A2U1P437_ARTAN|nr:glucose/ribitol dehydrogenase [Artemisia annua]